VTKSNEEIKAILSSYIDLINLNHINPAINIKHNTVNLAEKTEMPNIA
jgi:hypothetical protein